MAHPRTPATSQPYEVLFFDDFTSPELDRSASNVKVTGQVYNNEKQATSTRLKTKSSLKNAAKPMG